MKLSVKEDLLVKDLIAAEKLTIEKYQRSSTEAKNGGLKNLLTDIASVEQTHLNTLNSIQSGQVPSMAAGGCTKPQVPETTAYQNEADKKTDAFLCTDLLTEEKQISGMYEVSIFEFAQPELRNILNHIQGEEQNHGQFLYEYMTKANITG